MMTVTDEMIEAVARAIARTVALRAYPQGVSDAYIDEKWMFHKSAAEAAILAMRALEPNWKPMSEEDLLKQIQLGGVVGASTAFAVVTRLKSLGLPMLEQSKGEE
jgi:hypothetical protein